MRISIAFFVFDRVACSIQVCAVFENAHFARLMAQSFDPHRFDGAEMLKVLLDSCTRFRISTIGDNGDFVEIDRNNMCFVAFLLRQASIYGKNKFIVDASDHYEADLYFDQEVVYDACNSVDTNHANLRSFLHKNGALVECVCKVTRD